MNVSGVGSFVGGLADAFQGARRFGLPRLTRIKKTPAAGLLVVLARLAQAIAFNLADVDSAQAIGFRREDVAAVND